MPMIDSRPPEAIYEEIELDNKVNQNPEDTNKERTSKRRCLQKRLFWFIALISILASTAAIAIPLIFFNIQENKAIDCTWADWSSCNASCGGGKQVRSIEQPALHGGKNCTGEEVQDCNLNPCPIDCTWTDWSRCNASCGGGKQFRSIEQPA